MHIIEPTEEDIFRYGSQNPSRFYNRQDTELLDQTARGLMHRNLGGRIATIGGAKDDPFFPGETWTGSATPSDEMEVRFDVVYPSVAVNGYAFPTTSMAYDDFAVAGDTTSTLHSSNALVSYSQVVFKRIEDNSTYRLCYSRGDGASSVRVDVYCFKYSSHGKIMFNDSANRKVIRATTGGTVQFDTRNTGSPSSFDLSNGVVAFAFQNGAKSVRRIISGISLEKL